MSDKYFLISTLDEHPIDKSVLIGIPLPTTGLINYQCSLGLQTARLDFKHVTIYKPSHFIDEARNYLVDQAIEFNWDYIMFVDSDIMVNPYTIRRMLTRAIKEEIPVQAAVYMQKRPPFRIHVYDFVGSEISPMFSSIDEVPVETTFQADCAGAGCLLLQTETMKEIRPPLFRTYRSSKRTFYGEDIYFFRKLQTLGIPVIIDGSFVTHCYGINEYPAMFTEGWISEGSRSSSIKQSEKLLYEASKEITDN